MVMTAEQKKAKEHAEKFMVYLYEKYYPQIEVEMKKREELQNCGSSRRKHKAFSCPSFGTLS